MKKFEYLKLDREPLAESLNKLGADGWELVSVVLDQYDNTKYYFKREIENKLKPITIQFDMPKPQKLNEALSQEDLDKMNGNNHLKF